MVDENKKISERTLLYDPLFEKKPDVEIRDDPSKGLLGKAKVKKVLFVVALGTFIAISLFFSFYSVATDKYKFEENGGGYLFSSFRGGENDKVLSVGFVTGEDDSRDTAKPVNESREFAVCCNEYLEYIYISKTVEKIDNTSFYYCTALKAIFVDPENPNYASVDGVLYKKDNGVLTEIVLYPMQNGYYRSALALGLTAPEREADIEEYMSLAAKNEAEIAEEYKTTGIRYEIADTVTKIGTLCFSTCKELEYIAIPDGVKEIETLAFLKCEALKTIYLPDGLEKIGSDAFSSCKSVKYIFIPASVTEIGHHAFNNCTSVSCVYTSHKDGSGFEAGDGWLPEKRKVFMVDVDVLYGQVRDDTLQDKEGE